MKIKGKELFQRDLSILEGLHTLKHASMDIVKLQVLLETLPKSIKAFQRMNNFKGKMLESLECMKISLEGLNEQQSYDAHDCTFDNIHTPADLDIDSDSSDLDGKNVEFSYNIDCMELNYQNVDNDNDHHLTPIAELTIFEIAQLVSLLAADNFYSNVLLPEGMFENYGA